MPAELSKLVQFEDLVQNFVLGGLIVSTTSYVGTFFDPLVGAIIWSFPISLLPILYFMHENTRNNKYLAQFTLSTTYALILLISSTLMLSYFLAKEKENTIVEPVLKTIFVWFFLSIIFYHVVKYYNLEHKFM